MGAEADLRRAELANGSSFSFRLCYLPAGLPNESVLFDPDGFCDAEGRALSPDEEEGARFASDCLRAEKTALRLVARAEQTVFGLSRKLERRGADTACSGAVVSRLLDLGLLDDRRYARLWLESRIGRQASSPVRLLAALRARGVDREDADSALRGALDGETEWLVLERFMLKRRRGRGLKNGSEDFPPFDDDAARSLKYLLKSEGFSSLAIERLFDEYGSRLEAYP